MVPTCYGRQAILYEFEGLIAFMMLALIDSNRVVDCKALLFSAASYISVFYSVLDACVSHKSGLAESFNR